MLCSGSLGLGDGLAGQEVCNFLASFSVGGRPALLLLQPARRLSSCTSPEMLIFSGIACRLVVARGGSDRRLGRGPAGHGAVPGGLAGAQFLKASSAVLQFNLRWKFCRHRPCSVSWLAFPGRTLPQRLGAGLPISSDPRAQGFGTRLLFFDMVLPLPGKEAGAFLSIVGWSCAGLKDEGLRAELSDMLQRRLQSHR